MYPLFLDFGKDDAPGQQLGLIALVVAIVLVAYVGFEYLSARSRIDAVAAEIALTKNRKPITDVDQPPLSAEDRAEIQRVLNDFLVPWNDIFAVLERNAVDGVVLSRIEPDVTKRELHITGVAGNYLEVLSYVARLKADEKMTDAYLTEHVIQNSNGRIALQFSILAELKDFGLKQDVVAN